MRASDIGPSAKRIRRRILTEHDRASWSAYARTVIPLPGHVAPDPVVPSSAPPVIAPREPNATVAPPRRASLSALSVGLQPPGVDNANWQRFRTGKLPPSRTLDLHGQTAQRAFHSLQDFVRRAHADHQRCVEVITGRGAQGNGVLRRELPMWLNMSELRPLLLGIAHPHAANEGSVRLLIRRIR